MSQGFSDAKELRAKLRTYRKKYRTQGVSLTDLYTDFCSKHPEKKYREGLFQIVLLKDGSKVAEDVAKKCLQYADRCGVEGYEKFLIEQQYITRQFWNAVVPEEAKYLGEKDEIKPAKKTQRQKNSMKKVSDEECYENLLPVKWYEMSRSQKIQFARKVQHEGFFQYILKKDKRIKQHFTSCTRRPSRKLNLYISLFTFPSENYSKEAKDLLKIFVETLNQYGRSRLQWTELSDPPRVEIREIR